MKSDRAAILDVKSAMEFDSTKGVFAISGGGSNADLGRKLALAPAGLQPYSGDRTVSRHHLSLRLLDPGPSGETPLVVFHVVGRNPIWISSDSRDVVKLYRNSERGELAPGDRFSLSLKEPFFFTVRRSDGEEDRRRCSSDEDDEGAIIPSPSRGLLPESLNFSEIDPVKEFGFLVKGHEFDRYPKSRVRAMKDWNWFIDERIESSDEDGSDDSSGQSLKTRRRKARTKKMESDDDDDEDEQEWNVETDDPNVGAAGTSTTKYSTRSKDPKKKEKNHSTGRKKAKKNDVEEDEDDDETLGGFLVDDDEEGEDEVDEEEEEFECESDDD